MNSEPEVPAPGAERKNRCGFRQPAVLLDLGRLPEKRIVEQQFYRWLARQLPGDLKPPAAPGDDAATWHAHGTWVVATDTVVQDVDFRLPPATPRQVGHKALAVNLSDLAAMGARPFGCLVSLVLPRHQALPLAQEVQQGVLHLAQQHQLRLLGGDLTTWEGKLVVTVTVLGQLPDGEQPWSRSGAQPGDVLLVSGPLGGSILGRHLEPPLRVSQALQLRQVVQVHAAIDISDGLVLDLWRLCQASGCGAVLELQEVPVHPDAHRLAQQQPEQGSALQHALYDGEDFELLVAVGAEEAARLHRQAEAATNRWHRIGTITSEPKLLARDQHGRLQELEIRGYEH